MDNSSPGQSFGPEVNLLASERESIFIVKNVRLFVSVRVLRGQMGDCLPSNRFLDMFFWFLFSDGLFFGTLCVI